MKRREFNDLTSFYKNAREFLQEPQEYFAFIEQVDIFSGTEEKGAFVRFDCLTLKDAETVNSIKILSSELLSGLPFVHIECDEPMRKWKQFFTEGTAKAEDRWVMIETTPFDNKQEEIAANEFYNGNAQEIKYQVKRVKPNGKQLSMLESISKKFDLKKIVSPANKITLSSTIIAKFSFFDFLVVTDVGQGNLNFLTSGNMPTVYFDLGGGTGIHSFTYTSTIKTCKTESPIVILSHWDMDHLETAIRDRSNCSLVWIVPDQKVGKTHYNLAASIHTSGTLLIWPNTLRRINTPNGEIIKCTGTSKNNSGLAACVTVRGNTALLCADAAYRCIPGVRGYTLNCLVGSHHGSNSGAPNVPLAGGVSWIAYSYGKKNKWGHATLKAKASHSAKGWTNVLETIGDSIAFDTTDYVCPCGGADCNLSSGQHY
jgi:hypothetical protein